MGETTDEFITAGWLYAKPMAWMGRKAYHGAQRAGMRFQNWRWGAGGEDGSSAPATASGGAKWTSIEQHEETTMTYTHTSDTKWTR